MNEMEKKVMETIEKALPDLSRRQVENLLYFAEGMSFRKEHPKPTQSESA